MALPPGSPGVDVTAGEPGAIFFDPATASGVGPFTLHPVARTGTGTGNGSVCARGIWSAASPYGLAQQCTTVPFSAVRASRASFTTMATGGAVQGSLSGPAGQLVNMQIRVETNGRRIDGRTDTPDGTTYTIGSLPTGTYVVHAYDGYGDAGQSTQVRIVQGKITKGVDITLR